MNLYLVSQDINNGYDTFDSIIVSAETEEAARTVKEFDEEKYGADGWVFESQEDKLKVEFIGTAVSTKSETILESFNAG